MIELNNNKYFFLSGLPRTGSNLISSILNQNKNLHSEGNSALCSILWDYHFYINQEEIQKQMSVTYKNTEEDLKRISTSILDSYYNLNNKSIFDKNVAWTLELNLFVIKKYITTNPKIIVLTRNIEDIVKSYVNVYKKNGLTQKDAENYILGLDGVHAESLMRPVAGMLYSKTINNGEFFYIDYEDILSNPEKVIDNIYDFCEITKYKHQYTDIKLKYLENEDVILKGLIDVRPIINKRKIDVVLSENALVKIKEVQELIDRVNKNPKDQNIILEVQKFYKDNVV